MTSIIRIKTETRECQGKDPSKPRGLGLWVVAAAVVLAGSRAVGGRDPRERETDSRNDGSDLLTEEL